MTGKEALDAGCNIGQRFINEIKVDTQNFTATLGALYFCGVLGIESAAMAAWLGRDAALTVLDTVRKEIEALKPVT